MQAKNHASINAQFDPNKGGLQPWEIKQLLAASAALVQEVSDHDQG